MGIGSHWVVDIVDLSWKGTGVRSAGLCKWYCSVFDDLHTLNTGSNNTGVTGHVQ